MVPIRTGETCRMELTWPIEEETWREKLNTGHMSEEEMVENQRLVIPKATITHSETIADEFGKKTFRCSFEATY